MSEWVLENIDSSARYVYGESINSMDKSERHIITRILSDRVCADEY